MSELLSCPFCGAPVEVLSDRNRTWGLVRHRDGCLFPNLRNHEISEHDFDAWNSRAPIEYDGWFYLPKPKEGIVDYGEPEITRTENGYKVRHIAAVVDEAARKWGEELGEYVMRRICEIWSIRASGELPERTCHNTSRRLDESRFHCSMCEFGCWVKNVADGRDKLPNYCPNCGAKVVEE